MDSAGRVTDIEGKDAILMTMSSINRMTDNGRRLPVGASAPKLPFTETHS
jgi:hypothetical protein